MHTIIVTNHHIGMVILLINSTLKGWSILPPPLFPRIFPVSFCPHLPRFTWSVCFWGDFSHFFLSISISYELSFWKIESLCWLPYYYEKWNNEAIEFLKKDESLGNGALTICIYYITNKYLIRQTNLHTERRTEQLISCWGSQSARAGIIASGSMSCLNQMRRHRKGSSVVDLQL